MALRVAINGFGRIGRLVFRQMFGQPEFEIVAINDITDAATLAHLLKYDSVHGRWDRDVKATAEGIEIGGTAVKVTAIPDPTKLPWKELGIDLVIESTGRYTKGEQAKAHIDAGARWVVISAPAKGIDLTVVFGVNHTLLDPARHVIVSNGSCTTNCLAPVVKVLRERFGIHNGFLTTIHSYTNDQKILDLPHKDLRRARAAAVSMIPTSTGAAKAMAEVFPELKGKLDGVAVRVPTADVSLVDFTFTTEQPITVEAINDAFRAAAAGELRGILEVCEEPLVSIDFRGTTASSIVDALSTMVIGDRVGKVFSWYDNEYAYAARCVDVARLYFGR
ncbi:MAG TPA: type I glyceraldehyde-3-phosphate dehydrogenase [Thermoanaerobaculaceae bacterium]|nr:type I glyceraldehyde-3-phosphate dehydrogenase [Thermoanaerobaculaceae bacterium]HRS14676.1 type I glyceraldehyde-3-phosphate dehydrogenase [Thermoanaerobaculaceae bacterium]